MTFSRLVLLFLQKKRQEEGTTGLSAFAEPIRLIVVLFCYPAIFKYNADACSICLPAPLVVFVLLKVVKTFKLFIDTDCDRR